MDSLGRWVVKTVINTLRIYDGNEELERLDASAADESEKESREAVAKRLEEKKQELVRRVNRFMRIIVLLAIGSWLLDLWGYTLPFASGFIHAIFESLVTVTLGLIAWKFFSNTLRGRLKSRYPRKKKKKSRMMNGERQCSGGEAIPCCPWSVNSLVRFW